MSKMKNVISIVILAVLPFIGCIVYFSARTRANVMAFDPTNTYKQCSSSARPLHADPG